MNAQSAFYFGSDAKLLGGYAQAANDRLGAIDLIVENTGPNNLYFRIMEHDGVSLPSGYAQLGVETTLVPRGTHTFSLVLLSQQIGFFGSGNTTANISTVIRNKSNLRGAQIDLVAGGRRGYGYDDAFNKSVLRANWGSPPDSLSTPAV